MKALNKHMTHAIVIGGSMAGLVTSRVLANHFDKVTIIERDHFPQKAEPRKGVPQGRHVHVLLAQGLKILEELFPGLENDLAAAGAHSLDWAMDAEYRLPPGWLPRFRSGIMVRTCTRPLLEWHVHKHLSANEKVHFLSGYRVLGLLSDTAKTTVTGVRVRHNEREETLQADLVVDTSGRNSRASQWLEGLGYTPPAETVIDPFLGYASRLYQFPANFQPGWKSMAIMPKYPDTGRGGIIYPIEGGYWMVLLMGMGRDYPPTSDPAFVEFARGLVDPGIYEVLKQAKPVSPIYGYRQTSNRLRHYEKMARLPERFVTLGDAVCAFNPYYGQGMTTAALGALALDEQLRQHNGKLTGLPRRFQKQLAKINATPWMMATGEDIRWPETEGGNPNRMDRLMQGYIGRVLQVATLDPEVAQAFLEVLHMLKPPTFLMRPRIVLKVLKNALMPKPQSNRPMIPSLSGLARQKAM